MLVSENIFCQLKKKKTVKKNEKKIFLILLHFTKCSNFLIWGCTFHFPVVLQVKHNE